MRIDLEFAELHSGLFLGGTNFGQKIYGNVSGQKNKNKSNAQLEIWYETELEHTIVVWGKHVALIESTASKTIADPAQLEKYIKAKVPITGIVNKQDDAKASVEALPHVRAQVSGPGLQSMQMKAQVETPIDKVQGKPGRKPKFQGQEVAE